MVSDQKGRVSHPRLRHVVQGEAPKPSYVLLHSPRQFSEELLKKTLRGVSAQKHTEPVIDSAQALACRRLRCFRRGWR